MVEGLNTQYVYTHHLNLTYFKYYILTRIISTFLSLISSFHSLFPMQTLFTVVFFASFHEFVTVVKGRVKQRWGEDHTHYSLENDGEVPLTELHVQEGTILWVVAVDRLLSSCIVH